MKANNSSRRTAKNNDNAVKRFGGAGGVGSVPRLEVEHEASSRSRASLARLTFSNDLVEAAHGEGSSCATP
jgi:hypothetical protein